MFWHLKETFTIIFITIFVTTKVADEVFPNLDLFFFRNSSSRLVEKPEQAHSTEKRPKTQVSGGHLFRNFFETPFWSRNPTTPSQCEATDDDDDDVDIDVEDAVDFMSCANIPNASRRSSTVGRTTSTPSTSSVDVDVDMSRVKATSNDVIDRDKILAEKTALMRKVYNEPKPDPMSTFTAFVDFDFFSQIRQPWRRCKDIDINFIV